MTGRGDGRLIRPSLTPAVEISITLSTSTPTLDASSLEPFHLVITARILKSPNPDSPITLCTHFNPLQGLSSYSFHNIECVSPPESVARGKKIEIYPRSVADRRVRPIDLRLSHLKFTTIWPGEELVVKHVLCKERIQKCAPVGGEVYKVQLTNKALGTRWWCWGDLKDMPHDLQFAWHGGEVPPLDADDEYERYLFESDEESGYLEEEDCRGWITGEDPSQLALVVEKGEVQFEIM